ncbi:MAG: hypothetical protein HY692_06420 [Cyanobacteria bacterium NC_groundwater_1444_Ag_S-0.65um_54_12]|nr:hypothetical protein [Cyanobacteria bacterium NC_groundwater_1444_Ag_S-0.65um_54_12]
MSKIEENVYINVQRGATLSGLAKAYRVRMDDITRLDGTPASKGRLLAGDKLIIHRNKEPQRVDMLVKLLADVMAARETADLARKEIEAAKHDREAELARQEALQAAATDFNGAIRNARARLVKAEAADCTLAEREQVNGELSDLIAAAESGITNLDEVDQLPAQDQIADLKSRHDKLVNLVDQEQRKLSGLDQQFTTDREALNSVTANPQDTEKLGVTLKSLYAKYQDAENSLAGLSPDTRQTLAGKLEQFKADLYHAIVQYSDVSQVDRYDNSYFFGRPGPKMKKHLAAMEQWLASPAGPVLGEQRRAVLEHLSGMDQAVRNFKDLMAQAAAKAVYDAISAKAFERLASK